MMDMSCDVLWVGVLGTQGSVVVRLGAIRRYRLGYFVSKNQHIATWSPDAISAAQRAVLPGAAFGSLGPCRGQLQQAICFEEHSIWCSGMSRFCPPARSDSPCVSEI